MFCTFWNFIHYIKVHIILFIDFCLLERFKALCVIYWFDLNIALLAVMTFAFLLIWIFLLMFLLIAFSLFVWFLLCLPLWAGECPDSISFYLKNAGYSPLNWFHRLQPAVGKHLREVLFCVESSFISEHSRTRSEPHISYLLGNS